MVVNVDNPPLNKADFLCEQAFNTALLTQRFYLNVFNPTPVTKHHIIMQTFTFKLLSE